MVGVQSLTGFCPANCGLLARGKSRAFSWRGGGGELHSPDKGQPRSMVVSEAPGLHPCRHGALGDGVAWPAAARGFSEAGAQVSPGPTLGTPGLVWRLEQSCPESSRGATGGVGRTAPVGQELGYAAADCSQL